MFSVDKSITLAELKETFLDESTAEFEWTIPDCSDLEFGYYRSPTMENCKVCWYLEIYVETGSINAVYLEREVLTPGILESILCTIRWKQWDGFERDIARDVTITGNSGWWRTTDIPRLSGRVTFTCTLRRHFSPHARGISHESRTEGTSCSNGRKDVHVTPAFRGVSRETQTEDTGYEGVPREIQTEDTGYKGVPSETQTEDTGYKDTFSLSEHLKNLLLSGDGHDVLLKVGDKEFRAHKNILKVRSPVFASMFTNDMAESAENCVIIEKCDPDTFGDFLQFVYSGAVDITSVGRALGLYYAADKYDFPKLKEMCVHFLKILYTTSAVSHPVGCQTRRGRTAAASHRLFREQFRGSHAHRTVAALHHGKSSSRQ